MANGKEKQSAVVIQASSAVGSPRVNHPSDKVTKQETATDKFRYAIVSLLKSGDIIGAAKIANIYHESGKGMEKIPLDEPEIKIIREKFVAVLTDPEKGIKEAQLIMNGFRGLDLSEEYKEALKHCMDSNDARLKEKVNSIRESLGWVLRM